MDHNRGRNGHPITRARPMKVAVHLRTVNRCPRPPVGATVAPVRTRPDRATEDLVREVITASWAVAIQEFDFFPEGGGAHHWIAGTTDRRFFITCDDLDTKQWLGTDRDSVFGGLSAAYAAAIDLRRGGASFVVAPLASNEGRPAVRVDNRHSVSVFEYVQGEPGRWGHPLSPAVIDDVATKLAELHRTSAMTATLARRGLEVPGRHALDAALDDGTPWHGGPLSEEAHAEVAASQDLVLDMLADLDRLADRFDSPDAPVAVTHGEPHPGNLLVTSTGVVFVDWDTVAVAQPERDLWMLADDPNALARYCERGGLALEPDALRAYGLLWALADVAAFIAHLRAPHRRDPDTEGALAGLRSIFAGHEPSPYGRR
jgi:spectinomycin phosphotransferase